MPNVKPKLNPQPEPPSPALTVITGIAKQTDTCEIVTGAGVIEVNFRTRKVTLKHPEMGIPGGWSAAKALGAAITTWRDAKDVKGLEELRTQAERLLVCSVEAVLRATVRA